MIKAEDRWVLAASVFGFTDKEYKEQFSTKFRDGFCDEGNSSLNWNCQINLTLSRLNILCLYMKKC